MGAENHFCLRLIGLFPQPHRFVTFLYVHLVANDQAFDRDGFWSAGDRVGQHGD